MSNMVFVPNKFRCENSVLVSPATMTRYGGERENDMVVLDEQDFRGLFLVAMSRVKKVSKEEKKTI